MDILAQIKPFIMDHQTEAFIVFAIIVVALYWLKRTNGLINIPFTKKYITLYPHKSVHGHRTIFRILTLRSKYPTPAGDYRYSYKVKTKKEGKYDHLLIWRKI